MKDKTIKLRKRDLARLVRGELTLDEARRTGLLLIESDPIPQMQQTDPTMYENDSIDTQIDKFLLQYDPAAEQTPTASANEALLRESDDDEEAPVADPNAGKPPVPAKRLDLMSFASDIARLVEKSDMLLDVKGVIVRRALNYVTKNYDPKQAKDIEQILENNFGVSSEPGSDPYNDESAPFAVGAGASSVQQGG